ncbi:MAG: metal-dependent hydrolase, partial [Desulfobacterota bacterium]|nr:metal-dependent hydrolase [Thermodesulfobacteriota bacterium]
ACFKLISPQGITILIDPWIKDNPQSPESVKDIGKVIDYLLVSHAHGDHLGDTLELAKSSGGTVVSMPEIAHYLKQKGLTPEKTIGMNKGGSVSFVDFRITMVNAFHSSSFWEGNKIIYGGEAAGFIIRFNNGFTVYHAGDTGVFSDMKIIGELYKPNIALLPIGNHYVMGPEEAVYACKLLNPSYVIPMHYGTFPVLTGTPEKFKELMRSLPEIKVLVLKPGETIE